MALYPDYCTTAELKAWIGLSESTYDTLAALCVTAASRDVDTYCNRQFGVLSSGQARRYVCGGDCINGRMALGVDDLMTTTDLAVVTLDAEGQPDQTLTVNTDFLLWPYNADENSRPWTYLALTASSPASFYPGLEVQVTARWGWTAVPDTVKQATLIDAARIFSRRVATFGVAGSPEVGSELRLLQRLDVDASRLLGRYRRVWAAA